MNDRNPPVRDTSDDDDDRFLGDPLLPAFYREEQDTYFSLGIVVNWATTSTTCSILSSQQSYNAINYERFVSAVKAECFCGRNNNDDPDIPFFCPFMRSTSQSQASFKLANSPNCPRLGGSTQKKNQQL